MRTTLCHFSVIALVCYFSCTKPKASENISNADIMFVNVTETGSKIEPLVGEVNDTVVTGNLYTLNNSGYIPVYIGIKNLSFWLSNGPELVDTDSLIQFNYHYSVFAVGPLTAPREVITPDDLSIPSPGSAKVRFANFCSSNPEMFFSFGNLVIDTEQYYLEPYSQNAYLSGFYEVTPGTSKLEAINSLNPSQGAVIGSQTFLAGRIYTVIFCDSSTDGTSGFYLTVINNQ